MVVADREPHPQHVPTFYSSDFIYGVWAEYVVVCRILGSDCS
jgi:hypothetical protein